VYDRLTAAWLKNRDADRQGAFTKIESAELVIDRHFVSDHSIMSVFLLILKAIIRQNVYISATHVFKRPFDNVRCSAYFKSDEQQNTSQPMIFKAIVRQYGSSFHFTSHH
jgi:hypothetical protein